VPKIVSNSVKKIAFYLNSCRFSWYETRAIGS